MCVTGWLWQQCNMAGLNGLEGLGATDLAESSLGFHAAAHKRVKVGNANCHQTDCHCPLLAIP